MPDTAKVASLNGFWTNRIWREARENSERLHSYQLAQRPLGEQLVSLQRQERASILETKFRLEDLRGLMAASDEGAPARFLGWDGQPEEAWRIQNRILYWHQLVTVAKRSAITREDATPADWVGSWLSLTAIASDPVDFTRFWLDDVAIEEVPRNWLRWAIHVQQATTKVTDGNPADEQHAAYLLDADLFLTADVRFARTVEAVAAQPPFNLASPVIVPWKASDEIVANIARVLSDVT